MITLNTRKSAAITEWMRKESASYEDFREAGQEGVHVYDILNRFGGKINLTYEEVRVLYKSGNYHLSWDEEDIQGGDKTLSAIKRIVDQLKPFRFL